MRVGRPFWLGVFVCSLVQLLVVAAPAFALDHERAYEMVSPPYKGGYGVTSIEAVAQDGESVIFFSPGVFAGIPAGFSEGLDSLNYMARRGAAGWSTVPLTPPDALSKTVVGPADVAPSLESMLALVAVDNPEEPSNEESQNEFLLHSTAAPDLRVNWESAGTMMETLTKERALDVNYIGGSSDFCHLLLEHGGEQGESGHLLPAAKGALVPLYEMARGCDGEPTGLRLVALDNQGKVISPVCSPHLGETAGHSAGASEFNAVSADGSEVFFTTCVVNEATSPRQLFVRLGGARTLEVSKPLGEACAKVPCTGAAKRAASEFVGADESGSRVFFTTSTPLGEKDKDLGNDLYMASIGCPESDPECQAAERIVTSLVQVSADPIAGEAAEVQGVVRVSPDGSHVYFVARGVLGEGPGPQGALPVKGADNLYVYERDERYPAGHVAFIGDLCSGYVLSGEAEDLRCPSETGSDLPLWTAGSASLGLGGAQTAGVDGRYLVFSSYAQLVPGDTDTAQDVYRYDAQSGVLERVSIGEDGYDANGNSSAFNADITSGHWGGPVRYQHELDDRAVSEDGSRIVFKTSGPLSPQAVNGLSNVYEWREGPGGGEGRVSLISSGDAEAPVQDAVISPSGDDVFFITTQGLAAQDTDGVADLYDARIGGGFPPGPSPRQQCSSDACQGPLTAPAPLLVPGSVSQAPGGNFAAPIVKPVVKAKLKPKKKVKKRKKMRQGARAKQSTKGRK